MNENLEPIVILMAEDDAEDRLLTREALEESHLVNDLRFVGDGEELMDYLYRRGKYENEALSPRPDLLLLDLNMPKKDGREALSEIKSDPSLRQIPVVVLTTSTADEDILNSYNLGASSYISKPVTFSGLVEVMRGFSEYWIQIVRLPRNK